MKWWLDLAIATLAAVGLWVTVYKTATGILRGWAWLRRDRVTPLLEDDRPEGILCAGCVGDSHCDGVEGGCDCTCGWDEDWAEQDLPPEQSAEALGFTGPPPPSPEVRHWRDLEARRERLASAAEAEHRAAYESMGFEFPSGLMARVRELTP